MKKIKLIFAFFIAFSLNTFGQNNPVENLTWSQSYQNMTNFFELRWDEPLQPHNELIGYNIYRNNELFRFQTENSLYKINTELYGIVFNCTDEFLLYGNGSGFDIHVTAVYNPGNVESNYQQTVHSNGAALNNAILTTRKVLFYPNPTKGILNFENIDLEKIIVYEMSGKLVKEFITKSQIDLSELSKGLYVIKLFTEDEIIVDKIVVE